MGIRIKNIAVVLIGISLTVGHCFAGKKMTNSQPQHPLVKQEVDSLSYGPPQLVLIKPPALPPVPARIIEHGDRSRKEIALTFDACATRKPSHYDSLITRVLVETETPATIFLGGKWMEEETEQTKYLASLPQIELGNHTFLHPHLTRLSEKRIREELRWTQEILYTLTGRQATLFRPPYGEYNEAVIRVAAKMGLKTIEYDLPSGDPDSLISRDKLINYVTGRAKNGSIIVMHINRRGWHTAEALPEIIRRLRERGFTLVTVGKLLQHSGERIKPPSP